MNKSSYEFEGEPFIAFFFMLLAASIIGTGIFSFLLAWLMPAGLAIIIVSFFCTLFFVGNLIRWVYHNIGYHGRNVVIACIFAFLIFFWYGVGQELGGKSFFINLF